MAVCSALVVTFLKNRFDEAGAIFLKLLKIEKFVTLPEENWYIARKEVLLLLRPNSPPELSLKISPKCSGIFWKKIAILANKRNSSCHARMIGYQIFKVFKFFAVPCDRLTGECAVPV